MDIELLEGNGGDRPIDAELAEYEIHDVLRSTRRRLAIECLREMEGAVSLRALSERVAAIETDRSPAPRKARQSVYVGLHQCHLPKLDELGVIEYDADTKEISLTERVGDIEVYMEIVPRYGLFLSEFYGALGILALLTVVAGEIGVPVVSTVDTLAWATLFLGVIAASTLYQALTEESSILYRVLH